MIFHIMKYINISSTTIFYLREAQFFVINFSDVYKDLITSVHAKYIYIPTYIYNVIYSIFTIYIQLFTITHALLITATCKGPVTNSVTCLCAYIIISLKTIFINQI